MGFIDGIKDAAGGVADWAQHKVEDLEKAVKGGGDAPVQDAPPAPEAPPTPSQDTSSAAAAAHASDPRAVALSSQFAGAPLGADDPIPRDASGRYDMKAALQSMCQLDDMKETIHDPERCSCNSTAAAMLARGEPTFSKSLDDLAAYAKTQKGPYAQELAIHCATLKQQAKDGQICPNSLQLLADSMYDAFHKKDAKGKALPGGLDGTEIWKLQQVVGLTSPGSDFADVRRTVGKDGIEDAQCNATLDAFDKLKPGDTATLIVSSTGKPPYNHAITIGKKPEPKPDGTPFYFNSGIKGATYKEGPLGMIASDLDNLQVPEKDKKGNVVSTGFKINYHDQGKVK